MQWCALDLRPLSVTQGVGFKRLMAFQQAKLHILSRTHLIRSLRKHRGDAKKVKALLRDEADGLSLTTDAWTSNQMQSYAPYSCHFVHKTQRKFVTCVLETAAFPGHHTAINIVSHATASVMKFDLQDKVIACVHVHDKAANMEYAGRQLENAEGWISWTCSAHKMETCINHVIKAAARKLVSHFKHSTLAIEALMKGQERRKSRP